MFMQSSTSSPRSALSADRIADLRLAASKMTGTNRRAFQAEMTLKYCAGNARQAETVFGWGRSNIEVGLAEKRTGVPCLGLQSAFSGRKRWEDEHPEAAVALRELAVGPCATRPDVSEHCPLEAADG